MVRPNWLVRKAVKDFDLTSATKVAEQNGTITGNPTFSRAGINLDGTSDYVTYNIQNTLFAHAKISIVIEFTPDFAFNEDAFRYLIDSTDGNRYSFFKNNNAGSNTLQLNLNDTTIATIASGTYSSFWKQNQRNVIVISGTTGATNVWLNGNQILTADATVWNSGTPTEFYVGSRFSASSLFDGEIHSISIYNDLLTGDEAQALYDNSLFNFQNKSDVWLDMKTQSSDDTNDITKDKSGQGNDFLIGDGSTANTQPSFSNPGFDFDGSSDYMISKNSIIDSYTEMSFVICIKPDFEPAIDDVIVLVGTVPELRVTMLHHNTASNNALRLYAGGISVVASLSDYEQYWNTHGVNVFVATMKGGERKLYLNRNLIINNTDATAFSASAVTNINLGRRGTASAYYDGSFYHYSCYPFILSPTQGRMITTQLFREYAT